MGHFVYVSVFGSICVLIIARIIFVLVVLIMDETFPPVKIYVAALVHPFLNPYSKEM
jgi:hypothetical protein